ncbi:unnamed protein product [Rhizoctonia solani]|uniref:Uncharacterized protein n=1 Tax=Rhizoctonia solani TaxID=456999 RepID=A0A8H3AEC7_9AGAM|nr:unnamed protein product [Rhizoctonia solani]
MSANLAQNTGGFRAPDEYVLASSSANADTSHLQSNNPYRSPGSGPGLSGGTHDQYPNYDPPSYEQAAPAHIPPTGDCKREQELQEASRSGPSHAGPSNAPDAYQIAQPTDPANNTPSLMSKVMSKLNPRDPLDPPPTCFNRVVPAHSPETAYPTLLQPFIIHSKPGKKFLGGAFAKTGTPALHRHDVLAEDWVRLLEDIHIAASLTTDQIITSNVIPMAMSVGLFGLLITDEIEEDMKKKNVGNVVQLLQIWNERFFRPRRLEITLCRGDYRVPTRSSDRVRQPAPDRPDARPLAMSYDSSGSGSSSSSSDNENESREQSKAERKQIKREKKAQKQEKKRVRQDERKKHRADIKKEKRSKEPFRLTVISV